MARLIAGIDKLALKIQMKIELANFFFLFFANIQIRPIKKKKNSEYISSLHKTKILLSSKQIQILRKNNAVGNI